MILDPRGWESEQRMRALERTPFPANVRALLDTQACRHPERPFLAFFEDDDTLTYGDFARLVASAACALSGLGVRRGTHVGVMLPTDRRYPVTWMALASLGAVTVPINFAYTARELAYMLADGSVERLVIHHELLPVLEAIDGGLPLDRDRVVVAGEPVPGWPHHWERLVAEGDPAFRPPPGVGPDDLMNIQYTSGTTGMPKGAMQTHRYWLTFGRVGAAQFQDRLERLLIAQPFYYVDAQWLTLVALWQGATAYLPRRMSATRFLEWLRRYRIQYCNFPEVVSRQDPRPDDHLEDLVVMSCYSHRKENYRAYEARYGGRARQGFSMTEVGCALYVPLEADHMTGSGTVGIPVALREVMVADEAGQAVADGELGEICVRGPGILRGYWRNSEATAAAFHGDWFRTGDLGRRDPEGWFHYLGRMKDMVRRSSENISAVEVEGVLRGAPGVIEAAVLPVPDELRGEEVKAYLRLMPGTSADEGLIDRILAHCRANLAPFKLPRYLELVEDFPRTPSLKIKKSALIAARADLREESYDRVDGCWRRVEPS